MNFLGLTELSKKSSETYLINFLLKETKIRMHIYSKLWQVVYFNIKNNAK